MFCMKCGKKIDDDSKFCPFCGNVVANSASNAGVQPNVNPVMQTAKFFNKKIMIGAVSCIVAVAAVIVGVNLLSGGFGKTIAEQLFLMSWTELADLDEKEFKSSLRDEGIVYEEDGFEFMSELYTQSVSPFMGYDSYFAYDNPSYIETYGMASFELPYSCFVVVFDTKEDYEDGKDDIERYLEKTLVKGYDALTENMDGIEGNMYLSDISTEDLDKYIAYYEDAAERFFKEYEKGIDNEYIIVDDLDESRKKVKDKIKDIQENLGDYKVYKFSTAVFADWDTLDDEILSDADEKSLKYMFDVDDYFDYGCFLMNTYMFLTDEEFQSFMADMNYDAIDKKEIDLDEVRKTLDVDLLDSGIQDSESDLRAIYFMENHGIDIKSDMDVSSDELKRIWYIKNYGWDSETSSFVDLSDYNGSRSIYCAVTLNYDISENTYFEDELKKAVYLSEQNFNLDTGEYFESEDEKRLYFMKNYSYDTLSKKLMDGAVAEALFAYADYIESVFTTEEILGYNLIFIDDNDIPECVVWTGEVPTDNISYANRAFVLSFKNGAIESVTTEEEGIYTSIYYKPKCGDFSLESGYDRFDYNYVFTLDDSFHKVYVSYYGSDSTGLYSSVCEYPYSEEGLTKVFTFSNAEDYDSWYAINGQSVSEEEFTAKMEVLDADIEHLDNPTRLSISTNGEYAYFDSIYNTLLAAYNALRTTTYVAYAPEVAEFELTDGILTLITENPAEGLDRELEDVWYNPDPLISISYPVAEDCTWEYYNVGESECYKYGSFETMKENVATDKACLDSPFSLYIEVMDDVVIRVYSIAS